MQNHRNGLTAFPLISFLAKGHCYHPKLGAKQRVNQQHNPEIFHGEEMYGYAPKNQVFCLDMLFNCW